jgi:hypothetical protein
VGDDVGVGVLLESLCEKPDMKDSTKRLGAGAQLARLQQRHILDTFLASVRATKCSVHWLGAVAWKGHMTENSLGTKQQPGHWQGWPMGF